MDIFISYNRNDEGQAQELYELLTGSGYQVWMDKHNIPPGAYWPDEIDKGLRSAQVTLGMISPDALNSRNVKNEWDWTLSVDKPLILLRIRDVPTEEIPHRYISINYLDFSDSKQQSIPTLMATIQALLKSDENTTIQIEAMTPESLGLNDLAETRPFVPMTDIPGDEPDAISDRAVSQQEAAPDVSESKMTPPPPPETQPAPVIPPKLSKPAPASPIPVREGLNARSIRQRAQLIEQISEYWIEGYYHQSLRFGMVNIELENNREYVLQHSEYGAYQFHGNQSLSDIFKDVHGQLLILGKPGAGKTTLVLQLAKQLIDVALLKNDAPIPVIFNLTTWANRWKSFGDEELSIKNRDKIMELVKNEIEGKKEHLSVADWIVYELHSKYEIDTEEITKWLAGGNITIVFDGLDEVIEEYRDECVEAINVFRQEFVDVDIVVCSRIEEYDKLSSRLEFPVALMVQDISKESALKYLKTNASQELLDLYLQDDAVAQLFITPFWLSFTTYVYRNISTEGVEYTTDSSVRAIHVLETYTNAMLADLNLEEKHNFLKNAGRLALQMETIGLTAINEIHYTPRMLNKKEMRFAYLGIAGGLVTAGIYAGIFAGMAGAGSVLAVSFLTKTIMKRISGFDINAVTEQLYEHGMMYKLKDDYVFLHLSYRDYLSQNFAVDDDKPADAAIFKPETYSDLAKKGRGLARNLWNRVQGNNSDDDEDKKE